MYTLGADKKGKNAQKTCLLFVSSTSLSKRGFCFPKLRPVLTWSAILPGIMIFG